MRRCNRCKEFKAPSEFHRSAQGIDGLAASCKECVCAARRNWYKNDPKHAKALETAAKQLRNKAAREALEEWRLLHPAVYPDRARRANQRRRAQINDAGGCFTVAQIKALHVLQKGLCWWCQEPLSARYHIDHRIPLSRGGSNDISNLVLSCPHCNLSKGAKMPYEFAGRLL